MSLATSDGILSITVWPTYIGVIGRASDGALGEPRNYQRAQIAWTAGDLITGRARITVPAGEWTHFVYFRGPGDHEPVGQPVPIGEHPLYLPSGGVIDADPIVAN